MHYWSPFLGALGKIAKSDTWPRHFCLSVHPFARNNSAPTRWIFMKYITVFFENLSRKFKFHLNLRRITGILHEDQYACLIISCSLLRRMRNVSDKRCRENQNKHFMCNNFFSGSRSVYQIMWKNTVDPDRSQMTMAHAHCMPDT